MIISLNGRHDYRGSLYRTIHRSITATPGSNRNQHGTKPAKNKTSRILHSRFWGGPCKVIDALVGTMTPPPNPSATPHNGILLLLYKRASRYRQTLITVIQHHPVKTATTCISHAHSPRVNREESYLPILRHAGRCLLVKAVISKGHGKH